jgi:hypothetical protein
MTRAEQIKELLQRQALGDDDATEELALFLDGNSASSDAETRARAWAAQYQKDVLATANWKQRNPDIANDPVAYRMAAKVDEELFQRHPEMSLKERLDLAEGVVRERLGDLETYSYAEDIESLAGRRAVHHHGSQPLRTDDRGNLVLTDGPDPNGAQYRAEEHDHSTAIAAMQEERMQARLAAGMRAAGRTEPEKPRRAFAYPDPGYSGE